VLEASAPSEPAAEPHGGSLPEPMVEPAQLAFTTTQLGELRRLVFRAARDALLSYVRAEDLTLAVDELASNSIVHGGGQGMLRVWREPRSLVCEVRDSGCIEDPLAGRARPGRQQMSGRGLWLVNSACDLVQIRSSPARGTTVRVRMELG
jgi:anti-sigma regulatory factor (Ser/Thr protein kinase)